MSHKIFYDVHYYHYILQFRCCDDMTFSYLMRFYRHKVTLKHRGDQRGIWFEAEFPYEILKEKFSRQIPTKNKIKKLSKFFAEVNNFVNFIFDPKS